MITIEFQEFSSSPEFSVTRIIDAVARIFVIFTPILHPFHYQDHIQQRSSA
jgi:hypothetical protein